MRGSPSTQLALLILGFFLLALPLVRMTQGKAAGQAVAAKPVEGVSRPVFVSVRFAHQPLTLSLKSNGRELMPSSVPMTSPVGAMCQMETPAEGMEFVVSAAWPEGTPDTALTIEVQPDGLETRKETVWSMDRHVLDAVSFAWK